MHVLSMENNYIIGCGNGNDTSHTHPLPFLTWHDFWHTDGYGHGTQLQDLYNRWERVAGTEGSTTTTSMWDVEGRWRWTGKRLWWDRAKIHRLRLTGMGSTSLRQQINGSLIRSWGVNFRTHQSHWIWPAKGTLPNDYLRFLLSKLMEC